MSRSQPRLNDAYHFLIHQLLDQLAMVLNAISRVQLYNPTLSRSSSPKPVFSVAEALVRTDEAHQIVIKPANVFGIRIYTTPTVYKLLSKIMMG